MINTIIPLYVLPPLTQFRGVLCPKKSFFKHLFLTVLSQLKSLWYVGTRHLVWTPLKYIFELSLLPILNSLTLTLSLSCFLFLSHFSSFTSPLSLSSKSIIPQPLYSDSWSPPPTYFFFSSIFNDISIWKSERHQWKQGALENRSLCSSQMKCGIKK